LNRIKLNIAKEITAGKFEDAIDHANLILNLSEHIQSDNNLTIGMMIASSMKESAYFQLEEIYKKAGMPKKAKAAEAARASVRAYRKDFAGRISAAGYLYVLPVPEIQRAIVSAMAEDEAGLTLRFKKR
jgi:hypothetical protein